ncbi:hypothetical protein HAU46_10460 [Weissella confusa]|uniref:hypothetical protein n=1 Tax=Weissella confusa TaxID=1583 RepID=UPI0018F1AFBC|nr:hypothetical protein [Weissella confusa]MBJ7648384.1 hypothetical protein [Weissella confusa]MBJ7680904.1 hypothetical protein [Weissella confusa]
MLSIVGVTGYATIRLGEAGVKKAIKVLKNKKSGVAQQTYTFNVSDSDENGLIFEKGDTFVVVAQYGDLLLIEKNGNHDGFVQTGEFLSGVSDYKKTETKRGVETLHAKSFADYFVTTSR